MTDLFARAARQLRAHSSNLFVLVAAGITLAGSYVINHPAPIIHTVLAGVSAYPSDAVATWRDAAGYVHLIDPDAGDWLHIPARSVLVVVSAPVECSVVVDGYTVDMVTDHGKNVCEWAA